MKKLFLFSVAATLTCSLAFATIRRVGYAGIQLANVDFPNFQSAQDASAAGDTIQLYGSVTGTITKKLVLIGFGYNFDVHPGLQAIGTNLPSNVGLTFNAGSDGTIATGLSGNFGIVEQSGQHSTINDLTFQRCFGNISFYNHASNGPINNIKILSSVLNGGGMLYNGETDYAVNNLQVFNCIIYGFALNITGTTASFINCVAPHRNIVGGYSLSLGDASVLVRNCIIPFSGTSSNINTVFESNFFAEPQPAQLPAGSNNRWNQDWDVLFSGTQNESYFNNDAFDENYYVLKAGSPAINGGTNGAGQATDCGIFGGELLFVYRPGGVPAIPSIYKITAPTLSATANPYNVTISVKSNN